MHRRAFSTSPSPVMRASVPTTAALISVVRKVRASTAPSAPRRVVPSPSPRSARIRSPSAAPRPTSTSTSRLASSTLKTSIPRVASASRFSRAPRWARMVTVISSRRSRSSVARLSRASVAVRRPGRVPSRSAWLQVMSSRLTPLPITSVSLALSRVRVSCR